MHANVLRRVINRTAQDRWKDWSALEGCFGDTRITPSDVDGIVERNGQFLLLEGKSDIKHLHSGQLRMYQNLSRRLSAAFFILWGEPDDFREIEIWFEGELKAARRVCTTKEVRDLVKRWYAWADRMPA